MTIIALGTLGFPVLTFWIALYFQKVRGYSALLTGVHMLPMAIVGLTTNAVASMIQHKVSNKLLMGIGSSAFTLSFVLAAVQRDGDSYWAFSFPALCLIVIGIDTEFIVANVSYCNDLGFREKKNPPFDNRSCSDCCVQMYVLSSMPSNKQSIAGSLFQTISRLCTAVAYGIATAVFDAVQQNPSKSGYYAGNAIEPYAATFWFAAAAAFPCILLVPFLRIGTQGHAGDTGRVKKTSERESELENRQGVEDGRSVVVNDVDATAGEKSAHVRDMEKGTP
jgi:hypothetical protein